MMCSYEECLHTHILSGEEGCLGVRDTVLQLQPKTPKYETFYVIMGSVKIFSVHCEAAVGHGETLFPS